MEKVSAGMLYFWENRESFSLVDSVKVRVIIDNSKPTQRKSRIVDLQLCRGLRSFGVQLDLDTPKMYYPPESNRESYKAPNCRGPGLLF